MEDTYKTIAKISTGQFKDKGSRFIGFLFPVSSEEEIKNHLTSLKKEYYDATHHCYAYTFGHTGTENFRLNDDGEPSGSAGRPIFGQLQSAGLKDVLAVVIRYFGGTKLGIPGLINAYKGTTRLAIEQAGVIEKKIMRCAEVRFPFERMNTLMTLLKKGGAEIRNMDYSDEGSVIRFEIIRSCYPDFAKEIERLPYAVLTDKGLK